MASRTEANLGHIAGSSIAETPLPYKRSHISRTLALDFITEA